MPGRSKKGGGLKVKKSPFYLRSGNTTSFKKMGSSPAKQKYDASGIDERVYDIDQDKYDKWSEGTSAPDIRYLGGKENKKHLEAYLAQKGKKPTKSEELLKQGFTQEDADRMIKSGAVTGVVETTTEGAQEAAKNLKKKTPLKEWFVERRLSGKVRRKERKAGKAAGQWRKALTKSSEEFDKMAAGEKGDVGYANRMYKKAGRKGGKARKKIAKAGEAFAKGVRTNKEIKEKNPKRYEKQYEKAIKRLKKA